MIWLRNLISATAHCTLRPTVPGKPQQKVHVTDLSIFVYSILQD